MKKILLSFAALFLFAGCAVRPAHAQFIGFTSPQTVQQTLATNVACAGTTQSFAVMNLGQTQHTAILVLSGTSSTASLQIQATDNAANTFIISPTANAGAIFSGISAIVTASGYYPVENILVQCPIAGGTTFTLTYVGTSSTPPVQGGVPFLSLIDQQIFSGITANQNSGVFQTPFGSSSGTLSFRYASTPVAGSTVSVLCTSTNSTTTSNQFVFLPANQTGVQAFHVPPYTCPDFQVLFTDGGSSGPVTIEYIFDAPGNAVDFTLGGFIHITGTTATAVKATAGTFLGINLNTSASGTISVFDLATASCTGTPATNTVAVLTIAATENARAIPFNIYTINGICVKASAAMDFTVSYQ